MKKKLDEDTTYLELLKVLHNHLGEGPYRIKFTSDDGGSMVHVQIGMKDPLGLLEDEYPNFPLHIWPSFMGHRVVIVQMPKEMLSLKIMTLYHKAIIELEQILELNILYSLIFHYLEDLQEVLELQILTKE